MTTPATYLADGTPVVNLDASRRGRDIPLLCAVTFAGRTLRLVRPDIASLRRLSALIAVESSTAVNVIEQLERSVIAFVHPADRAKFIEALDDENERIDIEDLNALARVCGEYAGGTDRPLPEPLPSAPLQTATSTPSMPTLSTSEVPSGSTISTPDVASHGLSNDSLGVVTTTVNPKASAPSHASNVKSIDYYAPEQQ
jgi:hypothetical protein